MECNKKISKCIETKECCKKNYNTALFYLLDFLNKKSINYWTTFQNNQFKSFNMFTEDFNVLKSFEHKIFEDGFFLTQTNFYYSFINRINISIDKWHIDRNHLCFFNIKIPIKNKIKYKDIMYLDKKFRVMEI